VCYFVFVFVIRVLVFEQNIAGVILLQDELSIRLAVLRNKDMEMRLTEGLQETQTELAGELEGESQL